MGKICSAPRKHLQAQHVNHTPEFLVHTASPYFSFIHRKCYRPSWLCMIPEKNKSILGFVVSKEVLSPY